MEKIKARITERKQLAEDAVGFRIEAATGRLPQWESGAHISVFLPGGIIRQYSLCGDPHRFDGTYSLGVLREPKSRGGSVYLADRAKVGDVLEITSPMNHFPLKKDGQKYFLFAGGIGITPILSHAYALKSLGKNIEFHYCSRTAKKMAFQAELLQLGSQPAVEVSFHYDDGPEGQRLNLETVLQNAGREDYILLCGPEGFMKWVEGKCAQAGIDRNRILSESFVPAAETHTSTNNEDQFEVQIQSTGAVYTIPPDQSIADVLISNGIDVALSCSAGICGICVTPYVSGDVIHNDSVLSDEDRDHEMTICCSRAKGRLILKI
jgi:vanillate O-demethylase ferredoxin subunit